MASISTREKGYLVQFTLDSKRKTISFSKKYKRREIEEIACYIDNSVTAIEMETTPDKKTLAWLRSCSKEIKGKLERAGIIKLEKTVTLQDLLDAYYFSDEYFALKPTSMSSKKSAKNRLLSFYPPSIPITEISKQSISQFVAFLLKNYSQATKAGTIRDVKRIFNWGIENEIITVNPFANVQRGSFKNKSREHYVTMEQYDLMLAECKTQTLRTLLALYRIGGLRKEEAMMLTWKDIDFETGKLTVHSPKTERYTGREERTIPLFPRLKVELESLRKESNGDGYVITTSRGTVFKRLSDIVRAARLERWERLIQNLRSSRAIDVYKEYGELAEMEWIGHSLRTAKDHYLHLLESDFQRALHENASPENHDEK